MVHKYHKFVIALVSGSSVLLFLLPIGLQVFLWNICHHTHLTRSQSIEEVFSKIKAYLHHHCDYYSTTIGYGIIFDMYEIVEIITPLDAAGYYEHAGYF